MTGVAHFSDTSIYHWTVTKFSVLNSVLNSPYSKVYEKFLLEKFKPFINTFLSKFIAAYRENYSSSHVLIRLTENWKQALDENFVVGTVLMDLSKAFDCIPMTY